MKNKLSGPQNEQLKNIYRMVKVAEDIYRRFGVLPVKFQKKHITWWIEEVGFWVPSPNTEYRLLLSIKKFCQSTGNSHWLSGHEGCRLL